MEGVSILDSDQSSAGSGGGGGGGTDGGGGSRVLDSLSKWAFGGSGGDSDDDMVHVFSLDPAAFYPKWLRDKQVENSRKYRGSLIMKVRYQNYNT